MKISIITVSFNSEETIRDTIESVISQTYKDIEYVIVDGESTDGTLSIINEYKDHISVIVSEKDNGLYDAMNKGVRLATGEVIGILNSDDIYSDVFSVEKMMNTFNANPRLDAVYADLFYVSRVDTDKIVRKWVTGDKKSFSVGWHPAHPSLFIKKDVYTKYGYFNLDYKLAADFEIMLRFIEKYNIKVEYLQEYIIKMRLGGETNKSFKNIFVQNIECIRAFNENGLSVNTLLYPFYRLLPKLLQFIK